MERAKGVVPVASRNPVIRNFIYWECSRCKKTIQFGPQGYTVVDEGKKPKCFSAGVCMCPGILWEHVCEDWIHIAEGRPEVVQFCSFGI